MRILITGICGFVGNTLARALQEAREGLEIFGFDNFIRPGSEINRRVLADLGIGVFHADARIAEDFERLPRADWVIEAAAEPSVLAGTAKGRLDAAGLLAHNLGGTIHTLEYCRRHGAGLILLSTSRVYSIALLKKLKLEVVDNAFQPVLRQDWPEGVSPAGVSERFAARPPVSLYGASKLASEILALEYGAAFGFPVWINRLGVMAGAGQFGRADQGIFSYWIHACASRQEVRFIGFGGQGFQVRDCLHPRDLSGVLLRQMSSTPGPGKAITNFSGGTANAMSLRQLHAWCEERFGKRPVKRVLANRPFDVPWLVLDSAEAKQRFGWEPTTRLAAILEEIAQHAERHPDWLRITSPT